MLIVLGLIMMLLLLVFFMLYMRSKTSSMTQEQCSVQQDCFKDYQQYFSDYHLIQPYTFWDQNLGMVHIEQMLVSPYGIFMLRHKNYVGQITGEYDQATWSYQNRHKTYSFQNPIQKGKLYQQMLARQLVGMVEAEHLHCLIVFSTQSVLQDIQSKQVLQGDQWVSYIQQYNTAVFSPLQVQQIISHLEQQQLKCVSRIDTEHAIKLTA